MVAYLRLRENIYTIRLNNEILAVCDLCDGTRQHIVLDVKGLYALGVPASCF